MIESLPPDASSGAVFGELSNHMHPGSHGLTTRDGVRHDVTLPIADVIDLSTSRIPVRIAVMLRPGTDPGAARDRLAAVEGITTQARAAYPGPLVTLLRTGAGRHKGEDIAASLTRLQDTIRRDRRRRNR